MTQLFKRLCATFLAASLALLGPAACADDAADIAKLIKRVYSLSVNDFACFTPDSWLAETRLPDSAREHKWLSLTNQERERYLRPVFEPLFTPDLYSAFMLSCVSYGMAELS